MPFRLKRGFTGTLYWWIAGETWKGWHKTKKIMVNENKCKCLPLVLIAQLV